MIWAGTVAPYSDRIACYGGWSQGLRTNPGNTEQSPALWPLLSPNTYLADPSGPLALHDSGTEEFVHIAWSETFAEELEAVDNQPRALCVSPGDNHRLSIHLPVAMQRTVAFFDRYVKGDCE